MLSLTWLAGCALAATMSVAMARAEGPWVVGLVAIFAAQAALVLGRSTRLPPAATWAAALGSISVGALGYGGRERLVYLALAALLLIVTDRFAALATSIEDYVVRGGPRRPPDPIARDFARVRREGSPLTVTSIGVASGRGSSRRLAEVAQALLPSLRITDAVVRASAEGVVVVLPGADERVALAVLDRLPGGQRGDLVLGTATFPEDGQTYALLKQVARSRRRPWPADQGPGSNGRLRRPPSPVDQPALLVETRGLSPLLRRAVDLALLALIAPLAIPVIVLLALVVRLDSPGPAFVRIQRLGRDGQPFGLLKLRSMMRDADRMKEQLRHLNTMAWPDFKIAEDPRVTRLGRVLRKYSLDELPQLWNVLRGDMTLVGPRPCSVKLGDYRLWQSERLDVTPGIVGRWQAEGRGQMDFTERCRLDIQQVRASSLRLNLRLFLATVRSVFDSKGAY
ncbi:MAG TPA: sugar transferase [Thermoleophilaceae bacterium]|nr:sugar transferase [Thermoleophilaceae bacterium]